ncbi:MAG: M23 family metallopeptidase [Myxococcota bacterium]
MVSRADSDHDPVEDHDPYGIDDRLSDHLAPLDAARVEGTSSNPAATRDDAPPGSSPSRTVDVAALDARKGGGDPFDDDDLVSLRRLHLSPRSSRAPITERLTRTGGTLRPTAPASTLSSPAISPSGAPSTTTMGADASHGSGAPPRPPSAGLDGVGPGRPGGGGPPPGISPRMTAVFGGLFGMATVASIVALLIQVFPVTGRRLAPSPGADIDASAAAPSADPEAREAGGRGPIVRRRDLMAAPWRITALKDEHRLVSGRMERKAFVTVLQEKGVEKAEVYRILKAFEGVRDFDRTGPKDVFTVAIDRQSRRVVAFEYEVSGIEVYQARTNDQGLLEAGKIDFKVGREEYEVAFRIGDDFSRSYRERGLEEGLTREINRAFNGRTSTEAFEEGGIVKVAVVEKTRLGAFFAYDHILAIAYLPPGEDEPPLRAYWFEGDDYQGYVDEEGRRPTNAGWRTPVPGAPVTSHFNPKRMHPILKVVRPHNGTDYGAPSGTPVYSANRGKVAFLGRAGGYGNLIRIDHPGGVQTGYAHLLRFAKGLSLGDPVATRQLIGYVGSTGRSTGPHLHFEAKRNGKYFNPLDLKLDALRLLPVGARSAFLAQKRTLDERLDGIAPPPPPLPPAAIVTSPASSDDEARGAGGDGEAVVSPGSGPRDDDDDDNRPGRAAASPSDDDAPASPRPDDDDGESALPPPRTPPPPRENPTDEGDDLLGDDLTDIE